MDALALGTLLPLVHGSTNQTSAERGPQNQRLAWYITLRLHHAGEVLAVDKESHDSDPHSRCLLASMVFDACHLLKMLHGRAISE